MGRSCPECEAGKHDNCTGWALNDIDEETPCGCYCQASSSDEEGST
ncbi:MAG TPA: hypothetical protein VIT65_13815 [Microlunatus sp.]